MFYKTKPGFYRRRIAKCFFIAAALLAYPLAGQETGAATEEPAKEPKKEAKHPHFLGLSVAVAGNQSCVSLHLERRFYVGPNKRLGLGYGFRGSVFSGKDVILYPSKKGSGQAGQELFIDKFGASSLNIGFYASYRVFAGLRIGGNFDLIGLGTGSKKTLSDAYWDVLKTSAKPAALNLFKGGLNDAGSLQSELFLSYDIGKLIALRAGYSRMIAEYKLDDSLYLDGNKSYGTFSGMAFGAFMLKL